MTSVALIFVVVVSCGNDSFSPSCGKCPQNKADVEKKWCGGYCYYDNQTEICKERKL